MFKKIKQFLLKRKMICSEIEQKKVNFVYWYLLKNYEKELKGKVDLPAFEYATRDMQQIRQQGKLERAYKLAQEAVLKKRRV